MMDPSISIVGLLDEHSHVHCHPPVGLVHFLPHDGESSGSGLLLSEEMTPPSHMVNEWQGGVCLRHADASDSAQQRLLKCMNHHTSHIFATHTTDVTYFLASCALRRCSLRFSAFLSTPFFTL